ncbi:MAG: hypothetical protein PHI01_02015 [Candidatus Izemoplasmatales bacterium]|nr:hypothetical protein [Candidatus Izemoplasmatales bacterium]
MDFNTLAMVEKGELKPKEAYRSLYPKTIKTRMRRAWFIKLRISVPDEKGVNRFLAILFFLPIPLFIAKWALRFVKQDQLKDSGFSPEELRKLLSYRGIKVEVISAQNERVLIKTI